MLGIPNAAWAGDIEEPVIIDKKIMKEVRTEFYKKYRKRIKYSAVLFLCEMYTSSDVVKPTLKEIEKFLVEQCTIPGNYDLNDDHHAIYVIVHWLQGEAVGYWTGHADSLSLLMGLNPEAFRNICEFVAEDADNLLEK
jgi:hypothetical protein